jgi:two-component system chemotaxis response regulator CheY
MPNSLESPTFEKIELLASIFEVAESHMHLGQAEPAITLLLARHAQAALSFAGKSKSSALAKFLSVLSASLNLIEHGQRRLTKDISLVAIEALRECLQGERANIQLIEASTVQLERVLASDNAVVCKQPNIDKTKRHTLVTRDENLNVIAKREKRILVVEDDLISRRLLTSIMSKYGRCDVATSGAEGIVSFLLALEEGHPYELMLLDIMMPGMDGRRMLQQVRSLEEQTPRQDSTPCKVIMVSGLDDKGNVLGSFREGCEGYLVKPLDRIKMDELFHKMGLVKGGQHGA